METGQGRLVDLQPDQKKALLVGTYKQGSQKEQCLEQLEELQSLCDTYGLQAMQKLLVL